jgi:hypothetical protein
MIYVVHSDNQLTYNKTSVAFTANVKRILVSHFSSLYGVNEYWKHIDTCARLKITKLGEWSSLSLTLYSMGYGCYPLAKNVDPDHPT